MEDSNHVKKRRFREACTFAAVICAVLFFGICPFISGEDKDQWVYFHSDAIRGSVIDAETGEPLQGVLVVGLWHLTQIPGEGDGGFSNIIVDETDKNGRFELPAWKRYKPWKFMTAQKHSEPQLVIYKPGYKMYSSYRGMREVLYDTYMFITPDEQTKRMERYSITPARLEPLTSDEEYWESYHDFRGEANFPSDYYSRSQKKHIFELIKKNFDALPGSIRGEMKKNLEKYEEYWLGGKR